MGIIIVGLGPGDSGLLTREAWNLFTAADTVYLRTRKHPAVKDLPEGLTLISFDYLYDTADRFSDVYEEISREILRIANKQDIIYAVPGHPNVGESTVAQLVKEASQLGISIRIVAGLSFVEPVLTAIGIDALDGLQIFDAIEIASHLYPPCNVNFPMILGQVYNRFVASEVKLSLAAVYPEEHIVSLVHGASEHNQHVDNIPLYTIDRSDRIDHLTTLYVPPIADLSMLSSLAETVAVLRGPNGCPWDMEQTPQSMRDGFLEEAYEVLDALDAEDEGNLCEELGDLLYHIVMQAQMASESQSFTLYQLIAGIDRKLRRRHPHVWGDLTVADSSEVVKNWDQIKSKEKKRDRSSLLDGIPQALPALVRSQKIQNRVGKAGFDWTEISGIYQKIQEEIGEIQRSRSASEQHDELGDLFFVVVNLARWLAVDAESALRDANLRFSKRFKLVEQLAAKRRIDIENENIEELEELWEEAKQLLANVDSDAKV